MRAFSDIYATACLHRGGEAGVERDLPEAKSPEVLRSLGDDRYLAAMTRRIFQAGLNREMINAKWPAFEVAFCGFDPFKCAMLSDEDIDVLMGNRNIVRHLGKVKSVRTNAQMIVSKRSEWDAFSHFIADWPVDDIVSLWRLLLKEGAHLGGRSAALFLRIIGKDTFLLSDDVVAVLRSEGVIHQMPTSRRALQGVQAAFNTWHAESGRPYGEISRILSMTTF